MECDLNGFQSIRYVNGHVDILYSYDVSFALELLTGTLLPHCPAHIPVHRFLIEVN